MSKLHLQLRESRQMWWFVMVVDLLLVGAAVTLNVMHAPGGNVAHAIGGSAPVFLFLCVHLIAKVPATSRWLSFGRITPTVVVAGICFSISWQQQVNFMLSVGFSGWTVYAYPIMIDGAMLVTTLSLVEVTRKLRSLRTLQADLIDEAAPAPRPVTARDLADEERAAEYRRATERARAEAAQAPVQIRKPFELTPAVADAA